MLHSILIYQSETHKLLYNKNLQESKKDNIELFGGFLSALELFISNIHLDGSKDLKKIELGDNFVFITHIPQIKTDLIMIAEKEDDKIINRLFPIMTSIIMDYKELFSEREYNLKQFKLFNQELNDLILSNKKVIDEKYTKKIVDSIWDQKGEISIKLKEHLTEQKNSYSLSLNKVENLPEKLMIIKKIVEILNEINDSEELQEYHQKEKNLIKDISDRKTRLSYYLNGAKEALRNDEYSMAFSHLLSFSSKLQNFTKPHIQKKYQDLAKILLKKDEIDRIIFSQTISEILIMPDDIDEYLI
ncbi:MAG: hypothetical protein ACTSPS_20105 [Promethearchaeota archaeon]